MAYRTTYTRYCEEFDKIATSDKFITGMKDAAIPYSYRIQLDFQAHGKSVLQRYQAWFRAEGSK